MSHLFEDLNPNQSIFWGRWFPTITITPSRSPHHWWVLTSGSVTRPMQLEDFQWPWFEMILGTAGRPTSRDLWVLGAVCNEKTHRGWSNKDADFTKSHWFWGVGTTPCAGKPSICEHVSFENMAGPPADCHIWRRAFSIASGFTNISSDFSQVQLGKMDVLHWAYFS